MFRSAKVSFGKHEPPHPGPGFKNSKPMRLSKPIPKMTSVTSAPTASHSAAMALMKLILVAKKAFEAYLMVSAVVGSVSTIEAPVAPKSSATAVAARGSVEPTTIRSGARLSATAVPSRRNSGFETTAMSGRLIVRSTRSAVRTGTVDLLITMASGLRFAAISSAAAVT